MTLEGLIWNVISIANKKNLSMLQHIIPYHKICFVFVF